MQTISAISGALLFSTVLVLLLTTSNAHNVTRILAKHPEFSTFNHYLTLTHLAAEVNRRQTITVCAVDNAAMADLLSKHLTIFAIKNVLSLHILLDYFGAKKLHQITNGTALAATMFQATGSAPGSSGFVNITDLKGGKVGFGAEDNGGKLDAAFVKSLEEIPYNISIIQISRVLPSAEAEAPTPGPSQMNLTALMSKHGCKVFAQPYFRPYYGTYEQRNFRIFEGRSSHIASIMKAILDIVGSCVVLIPSFRGFSITDITKGRCNICFDSSPWSTVCIVWSPPLLHPIKKNIFYGSSLGNPGRMGLGGVFRNGAEDNLFIFSRPMGIGRTIGMLNRS